MVTHTRLIPTMAGDVEIAITEGPLPAVLFFPGGHCSATTDCGWDVYTRLGHAVVSFSRPGYGSTQVGPMDAARFADVVRQVCEHLEIAPIAAAVGVSFGGIQALHVAAHPSISVGRLVLPSCAPSTLRYPDTRAERVIGPVVFSAALEGATWRLVRRMVRSDAGLQRMLAPLSTLPPSDWWHQFTALDKDRARTLFQTMRSRSGFVNDLRQAKAKDADARRRLLERIPCPTLVTASRHDGGVAFTHAMDFTAYLPHSRLVELTSPTHLFWIGPGSGQLADTVEEFLS